MVSKEFAAKEKLEIVSGAAPPHFRIFAGGLPRRRRRRNAFGLIQIYCTSKEIASFEGSPRFARRLIRIQFWGQKRIGDFERRKVKYFTQGNLLKKTTDKS
ncbi:hypothetical protein HY091_03345 [Candidatus Kaiserbacteria bacterium]|nr:hypothetical protein [Candidatus Kaiserbacteria bacterium]